jgi:hypothetical protein
VETVNKMDPEKKSERLNEIVWCMHLILIPSPLVTSKVAHAYLPAQKTYIVVEEQKVKLLCPDCWRIGTKLTRLFETTPLARES